MFRTTGKEVGASGQFKYLVSPLKIGPIAVRNRMANSAHNTRFGDANPRRAEAGFYGKRHALYQAERARRGAGLIVLGQHAVHPTARLEGGNISIHGQWGRHHCPATEVL